MIYVHDNPQKLEYNAMLFCFMRRWYLPALPDRPFTEDSWLKVPAIRTETANSVTYTIINSKIEMTCMMMISDTGILLKANRVKLNQKIPAHQMEQIEAQALDVSLWEQVNQQTFPYAEMFDGKKMQARYMEENGTNKEAYFSIASANHLFTEIKRTVSPKPCNCGKAHYSG